jgi:cytochrome c oxidase assembly factor CtaG
MDKDDIAFIASGVILLVWLFSAIYGSFTHDYEALQLVTPVMLILAGYLFGIEIVRRRKNGNGNGSQ